MIINLQKYHPHLSTKKKGDYNYILDPVRAKYIRLQPEEMVRQLIILYIHLEFNFPFGRMQVEKQIKVGKLKKRFDLICYNQSAIPFLLVECKSYNQTLNEAVMNQISIYNSTLKIPYLWVSNGNSNVLSKINFEDTKYEYMEDLKAIQEFSS